MLWLSVLLVGASLAPAADSVPLYDNLGRYHRAISTTIPATQQYFDQGLRLVYAFNHGEAIRAFAEAARRDSTCAMCYWGIAYAYGPHVNAGMDSAGGVEAWRAIRRAVALAPSATPVERDFIQALSRRYAETAPADRAALDSAYAKAAGELARKYSNDDDALTLAAEALMDLRPWNYWKPNGDPYEGTLIALGNLERVIKRTPDHPGACHYYIHAVEAVAPEKAVPCAERLAALMPGAGHMVHMPAHIYIRVGRYDDAIEANEHAVHTDEVYIMSEHPTGGYPAAYYPHNYHFLAFASTLAGRSAEAIEAAHRAAEKTSPEFAKMAPPVEPLIAFEHLTLQTFGRWDELLALPLPPADLRHATGLVMYARGMAFAATGRPADAAAALDTVRAIAAAYPAGDVRTTLEIAANVLGGELAARAGQGADGVAHLRAAMQLEDGLTYIEPPLWHQPVRHLLGALLLAQGQAAEAEQLYREDLKRFPENGWALRGLALALTARGKTDEAAKVEARYKLAWRGADVALAGSRM